MQGDINLIFVLVVIAVSVSLGVIYMQQQRLNKERKLHKEKLESLEREFEQYAQELKTIHSQEIAQIKQLYPRQVSPVAEPVETAEVTKAVKAKLPVEADQDAVKQAKQIIAEARAEAKKIMLRQEAETQKSIVKVVIQVVRKVVGKTLTYDDHKKIIMDALKEL